MILRRRTFFLFALSLGLLALLVSALFWGFTAPRADRQDRQVLLRDLQRLLQAVEAERLYLFRIAGDWAFWTDSWRFLRGEKPDYLKVNLNASKVMDNLNLNYMIYLSLDGRVVHTEAYDMETRLPVPLPETIRTALESLARENPKGLPPEGRSGLLPLSPWPVLFCVRPVLLSDGKGPPMGSLFVGRTLDPLFRESVIAQTRQDFRILPLGPKTKGLSGWSPGDGELLLEQHARILPRGSVLEGLLVLADPGGNPALALTVTIPRPFALQARNLALGFAGAMGIALLAFGLGLMALADRVLLRRLERLTGEVDRIGDAGGFKGKVTEEGEDELSRLQQSLNDMLTQGRRAQKGRLLAELQLRRAHRRLLRAYDHTLLGWSLALDLRDQETENHTRRVTEKTLELARTLGFRGDPLTHLHRGSLLHDIGKLGVPDRILLKPGPLSPEEWAVMRRHPEFAYRLLQPIPYLRPALPIPTCHHEKWDGTGYPRGLKGEEIPLEARIFAVVDVWDALTSWRPYREAWPLERALEQIRRESGTHFDPAVVEVFLAEFSRTGETAGPSSPL